MKRNDIFGLVYSLLSTLSLLMVGASEAWGQTLEEGSYYIASHDKGSYSSSDPSNNYYLTAATGCFYSVNGSGVTTGVTDDNGKPFLTTYKSFAHSASANAVWQVSQYVKDGTTYYRFRIQGKQLVANDPYVVGSYRRISVHLEDVETVTDNSLFVLTKVSGKDYYTIRPKDVATSLALNPASANYDQTERYSSTGNGYGGLIGLGSSTDGNSFWYFEAYIPTPVITRSSDNVVTISCDAAGTAIYYTTDGSTPDPTDVGEGTATQLYTAPFTLTDGTSGVKAVAVTDGKTSPAVTLDVQVLFGQSYAYLVQSVENSYFYLLPGTTDTYGYDRLVTNSLARPAMMWYFLNAGTVNGKQYYYIVNKESGKHLFYHTYEDTNNTTQHGYALDADAEAYLDNENYMFSLEQAATGYNISPKAAPTRYLNKNGGNVQNWNVNTTTSKTATTTQWNMVRSTGDKMPSLSHPVSISSDNHCYYFNIANQTYSDYYLTQAANVITTTDASAWYVQEAGRDDWLIYYHIVDAATGQYLYLNKTSSWTDNPLTTKAADELTSDNADRAAFVIARSFTDGQLYIVPSYFKYTAPNAYYSIFQKDNNGVLQVRSNWNLNDIKWSFTSASFQCAAPEVSYNATQGTVSMSCSTPGAKIYYVRYTSPDGADPDLGDATIKATLTLYDGTPVSMDGYTYIKAIAARSTDDGSDQSAVTAYGPIAGFQCATPVIKVKNGQVTITCSTASATIYYTLDQEIDTSSPLATTGLHTYTGPFAVDGAPVIRAFAVSNGNIDNMSAVAEYNDLPTTISKASDITNMSGNYYLAEGFVDDLSAPIGSESDPFTGKIDGDYHAISLSHPLFDYVQDATIKNVVVSSVTISGGINTGTLCNVADGTSRIYNCGVLGGSISGSGAVGGLVGKIQSGSDSRVVNCYNYAAVSGGSHAAGIVGRNDGANARIALCMMYGDVTGATVISPVYSGTHTKNVSNFSEYNYFRSKAELSYTAANDQLAIGKDEYLTRFPFYRHILNTHRQLASYFLFGDYAPDNVGEIGHWALKTPTAPYPIVEPWQQNTRRTTEDIKDNLPATTDDFAGRLLTEMGNGGYLTLNITINDRTFTTDLPITDMDTLRYDYTWGKVVLPFANEFSGWTRDYSKVCTGWKITSVSGGTEGTFEHYDVCNRDCTAKDLYANSGYIFAQGGNYIVPYDVTAIQIEANFANAFYLSDPSYEIGYNTDYDTTVQLGGTVPDTYHDQTVYTDLATLVSKLSVTTNPHVQAIVLVGNYHYNMRAMQGTGTGSTEGKVVFATNKAVTIMSTDEDNNQEPDYGWYSYNSVARPSVPAMRFDFVPNIGIGMAAHVSGAAAHPGISIWKTRGWFELTETCVSEMSQCEIDSGNFSADDDGKGNNRWIANSGCFVQIVRSFNAACTKLSYIQIGGNAYVKELYPGNHSERSFTNPLVPINVTGGEIEECCMTGYRVGGKAQGSDIRFWCAGGKIHKFLGAYMETPVTPDGVSGGVNMNARIDHARIYRFFGGGTTAAAPITGNINVTINNSKVDFYCGGPEFGDMSSGKTVTTSATGTEFDQYYGAGFGGTALTNVYQGENNSVSFSSAEVVYPSNLFNYPSKRLGNNGENGIATSYKFEYIIHSTGGQGVARFYVGYAQFSLATTGSVTNLLNGCTVNGSFYGAGCQGMVNGTVSSTLTDCTVAESAYGGGYKAESNSVTVYPSTTPTYSKYIRDMGIFTDFGTVEPETFTWEQGDSQHDDIADEANKRLYTSKEITMSDLGNVTGAISLIIDGGTVGGNVFGGGNESKSLDNTDVVIRNGAAIELSVYGGGNIADVSGSTTVNMQGGTVAQDIYGGGALANTGGTTVNLTGGTVTRNVYGGGLGRNADAELGLEAVAALVGGDVEVSLNHNVDNDAKGCVVNDSIFGCNNINGTPLGNVTVHIYKTQNDAATQIAATQTAGSALGGSPAKETGRYDVAAVYGGGNMAAYTPTTPWNGETGSRTQVIIDGCGLTSIGYVYGGGNAAPVPEANVTVNGSFEIGWLFGGGNGAGDGNPGANVGILDAEAYTESLASGGLPAGTYGTGNATTLIHGGTIGHLFGGSNERGNIVGRATLTLDESASSGSPAGTSSDCPINITGELFGFGNAAPMDGEGQLNIRCVSGTIAEVYGGAKAADVGGSVNLYIASGTYGQVFGGNKTSGTIQGTVSVTIEETGCTPIIITELYGAGNMAAYTAPDATPDYPQVDIISCTSIGTVYGGGYGESAVVTGNPTVNINEVYGKAYEGEEGSQTFTATAATLGTVGTVFGGGNAASVNGDTYVNIGKTNNAANITGSIYGGGNHAEVSGATHVQIGQQIF